MSAAILLVEDDAPVRRVLRAALSAQGYRVWESASAGDALNTFAARSPHAVLLDLGLPDADGLQVVTKIRETSAVPIVILSARGEERDQVRALDGGANDYVVKPFREAELLARLRAVLRSASRSTQYGETIRIGPLHIQPLERRVFLEMVEVALTPTEFSLLLVMSREAGRVVTHRRLLTEVWGAAYVDDVQYLRVYMKQLRRKLERDPAKPQLLVTTPGVGYRLTAGD